MARTVRFNASVGRQRITDLTPGSEAAYVQSIRSQMRDIIKNYEHLIAELGGQSADILYDALEPTFELSQRYVPVDTGELKASGFLEIDKASKFPRVVIGYAKNGNPNYAAYVHEMLNLAHKAPTRAKFLLTALEEDAPGIQRRIVKGYKTVLGLQ